MNPLDIVRNFLQNAGQGPKQNILTKKAQTIQNDPNLIQNGRMVGTYSGGVVSPLPQTTLSPQVQTAPAVPTLVTPPAKQKTQSPTPPTPVTTQAQNSPDLQTIQNNMTRGFTKLYGKNTPALQYIPQIMEKVKSDPFYQNNPYLPAAQLVMESSGGANITHPNNPTNWGIFVPGLDKAFSQLSPQEAFDRYLTGIAGRDPNYKQYNTGKPMTMQELQDFGRKYVGPDDKTYAQRLYDQMQAFQQS